MSPAPEIDHRGVQRLVAERAALIVDALPTEDYAKRHLPGAVSIPIQHFDAAQVANIDRDRTIITYCADAQCDLSARAAARLVAEGFRNVHEYVGGIAEWGAYGLEFSGAEADVAVIGHVARRDVPTCDFSTPLEAIAFGDHEVAAVVDEAGVVLGRVRREEAEGSVATVAGGVMSPRFSTFRPDVTISEMAEWFEERQNATEFLITTPDGLLFGVLYRSQVGRVAREQRENAPALH
jgi:rhodanese-related sulfurtransferase